MEIRKHSHNEYTIMNEIVDNENISQRELSKKIGISVGTVNILINKMTKEGLIKMEQVTQKQVVYMLTPAGIVEKAKKAVSYLKGHYRAIYETKEKIKEVLDELNTKYENIIVLKSSDEMGELINLATSEYQLINKSNKIDVIDEKSELNTYKKTKNTVLLYVTENEAIIDELLKMHDDKNNVKVTNLFVNL